MNGRAADKDWTDRFARGDSKVLEEIYRSTFEAVRRCAGLVLREPADRDAVVQEVFADVVASGRLRRSWQGGDMAAWLGAIARHRALDFARREGRLADLAALPDPEAPVHPLADFRSDLLRFAEKLDALHREILRLRFVEGMTQVEAAGRLGMPRSTLEDREGDLKRLLREHLLGRDATAEVRP